MTRVTIIASERARAHTARGEKKGRLSEARILFVELLHGRGVFFALFFFFFHGEGGRASLFRAYSLGVTVSRITQVNSSFIGDLSCGGREV